MKTKRSRIKLPVKAYQNLVAEVNHRDGWKCRICKRRSGLHCHHVIFRSQGGDDIRQNLLTVCHHCHDSIHKPNPFTGACIVVMSKSGAEIIDTDDFKDTGFLFINNWRVQ